MDPSQDQPNPTPEPANDQPAGTANDRAAQASTSAQQFSTFQLPQTPQPASQPPVPEPQPPEPADVVLQPLVAPPFQAPAQPTPPSQPEHPLMQPNQHYQLVNSARPFAGPSDSSQPIAASELPAANTETVVMPPQPAAAVPTKTAIKLPPKVQDFKNKFKERYDQADKSELRKRLKPWVSTAAIGLAVWALFNSQLILGQIRYLISPGASAEAPAIVDGSVEVTPDPIIIIPKINLNVPVVYDVKTFDEKAIQNGLERGVVHYGTTAVPGQLGNNVIVGHSSNNWWAGGKYKFAFVLLSKLEPGDTFYLHYNSVRYTYEVTEKRIIEASDVSIINQNSVTPIATLITCDPPGTSWKRLAVIGKQIDPAPSTAQPAPTDDGTTGEALPGDGQSFWDWLSNLF